MSSWADARLRLISWHCLCHASPPLLVGVVWGRQQRIWLADHGALQQRAESVLPAQQLLVGEIRPLDAELLYRGSWLHQLACR